MRKRRILTEEHKRKIGLANKGRKRPDVSARHKEKALIGGYRGKGNPRYIHGNSTLTNKICQYCNKLYIGFANSNYCSSKCSGLAKTARTAIVELTCKACGKLFKLTANKQNRKRKFCSLECSSKGNRNPNWKGGCLEEKSCEQCGKPIWVWRSNKAKHHFCSQQCNYQWHFTGLRDDYPREFRMIRARIRKRDNYHCKLCNKSEQENSQQLSVHHIDQNKRNSKFINLISLCRDCHYKIPHNSNNEELKEQWRIKLKTLIAPYAKQNIEQDGITPIKRCG